MVGVKGSGGPPPKPAAQRRRRNKTAGEQRAEQAAATPAPPAIPTSYEAPPADAGWHAVATLWYQALGESGQSAFYQPSDWGTAYLLAESISRELNDQPLIVGRGEDAQVLMVKMPPKGASLAAWLKGMTALLATEGDRRRAAIDLAAAKPDPTEGEAASVSSLDAWRSRTDGTG